MIDLTEYEGVGVVFLALYLPDAGAISAVTLRLGSDNANYVELTVTEGFLGAFVSRDWQLAAFDLGSTALTTVGTPDFSNITYTRITFTYNFVQQNNVRVGDLWASLPSPHEVLFYSPAVFVSGDSAPAVEIVGDEDKILFHTAAYNIFVQEAAREVAKNQGGDIGSALIAGIDLVLEGNGEKKLGLYQQFRGDNPSEEIRQVGSYYDSPGPGGYGSGGRD